MRVLFADDRPGSLKALQSALDGLVPWEATFVSGHPETLAALDARRYDVIACASSNPLELMGAVKKHHPDVARIVRSNEDSVSAMMRTLFAAHQMVAADVDIAYLVQAIAQAADLQTMLRDDNIRGVAGRVERLPTRPAVYQELVQLLADPDSDFRAVGRVVQTDPAIATEIIRVVNTPFFSRGRAVTNIIDAVGRLGTRVVRDLVLAVEVYSTFAEGPNRATVEGIQRHSVDVAVAARSLVTRPRDQDDAFLAGLLHDIGRLVLIEAFPAGAEIVADERDGSEKAERELFGVTHADIGAYLIGLWGLPYQIMWAAVSHHEPAVLGEGALDVAGAVYVAEQILLEESTGELSNLEVLGTWRLAAQEALGMKNAS